MSDTPKLNDALNAATDSNADASSDALNDKPCTETVGPKDVFKTFLGLGCTSFGGPVAHIGYFHKAFVEQKKWMSDEQFAHLLAICQFLPGPASSQLGFAIGLHKAGWKGALGAFAGFTLPSAFIMMLFAILLPYMGNSVMEAAIQGLKLVACAVVADAVLGMGAKLCNDNKRKGLAIFAAILILLTGSAWMQLLVVGIGALAGMFWLKSKTPTNTAEFNLPKGLTVERGKNAGYLFAGLFFIFLFLSCTHDVFAFADAFYRAGALVFGGGHVVLPLLQDLVVLPGWVSEESFLTGYGAAQAIPGPMFTFAAYLGAEIPSSLPAPLTAIAAVLLIFLPGFLLLIAVLPLWQKVASNPNASDAIAGVNAVVVGLLGAALYDPIFTSGVTSAADMAIVLVAFAALRFWQLSPIYVVAGCVVAAQFI